MNGLRPNNHMIYIVKYKGEELCFCKTNDAALLILRSIRDSAYDRGDVAEMEAADTLKIDEMV